MTLFGISGRRLAAYAAALAVLVGLNVWRLLPETGAGPVASDDAAASPVADLPDLRVRIGAPDVPAAAARDLFRPDDPTPPPPPPEPEPEPAPEPAPEPVDPQLAAIRAADERLAAISVVGILSTGEAMVAVLQNGDNVLNVEVGDDVAQDFEVIGISANGIRLRNDRLGITRTLQLGGPGGG